MKLHVESEVRDALATHRPVVALESTLITHGLPRPLNLEVALELEETARFHGATPATVAILGGEIRVGLSRKELEFLAGRDDVLKCSRRDLPVALAQRRNGATTVAATMIIAHHAHIPVFATGGIGGVHRGQPFDVSADLTELAQTPLTVVCAGAKAILDLPLTLEALETRGVPVVGYGTDLFPAFYTRSSGLPVTVRCDSPEAVSELIRARDALQLQTGILVTVPVPAEYELPGADAEAAIQRALAEADQKQIKGKEVTPFLLARVSELTGAASQRANVALLKNNVRVAALIAKALSSGSNP